jgi:Guanosine polyphosphate pyrophosphohydrolases/synthetases
MSRHSNPHVSLTESLALELHGQEYYPHLQRVRAYYLELAALLPEGLLAPAEIECGEHAALLHDSIEDRHTTRPELEARGYSSRVVAIIEGLTRDPARQTYHDKMAETAASGDLVLIMGKLADNRDNSTPERIASLPPERRSLIARYRKARRTLFEGLATELRRQGIGEDAIDRIELWLGNKDTSKW